MVTLTQRSRLASHDHTGDGVRAMRISIEADLQASIFSVTIPHYRVRRDRCQAGWRNKAAFSNGLPFAGPERGRRDEAISAALCSCCVSRLACCSYGECPKDWQRTPSV